MPDYKSMYFTLAAGIADAIEVLEKAQLEAEEEYISRSRCDIKIFTDKPCKSEVRKPAKCLTLQRNAKAE